MEVLIVKPIIQQKEKDSLQLAENLKKAKSFLVFEYQGLDAKQSTLLRKKLHAANAKMFVAKNNILNRAFAAASINQVSEISGPNALIIGFEDEIAPFKEIAEIIKINKNIKYKIGLIENDLIKPEQLASLAAIPSREGLYSMLLSCLQASISNLARGIKAVGESK